MDLYCVDFDQGQWVPGMDDVKELAFEIDQRIQAEAAALGATAISWEVPPPSAE